MNASPLCTHKATGAAAASTTSPPQPRRASTTTSSMDSLPSTYQQPALSSSQPTAAPLAQHLQQQQEPATADAALYRAMRQALADFEAQQQQLLRQHAASTTTTTTTTTTATHPHQPACSGPNSIAGGSPGTPGSVNSITHHQNRRAAARMPPRQTAFYAALRSVLQQVLAEPTPAGRHTRLLAAHAWFVGHRPTPVPVDPSFAAALGSLSISSGGDSSSSSKPGAPQQQQQQHEAAAAGQLLSNGVGDDDDDEGADTASVGTSGGVCHSQQQQPGGALPASVLQHAQRLEAGAANAFAHSWPSVPADGQKSTSSSSSWRRTPGMHGGVQQRPTTSGAADAAAGVPGLIPVGCLPSARVSLAGVEAAAAAAAGNGDYGGGGRGSECCWGAAHGGGGGAAALFQTNNNCSGSSSKAAWVTVMAQQAALDAEVVSSMRGFARQRARIEEDISRRQELAAVSAAASLNNTNAAGSAGATAASRALQHIDSQHQPSQVTAELPTALTTAAAQHQHHQHTQQQLLVPDRVKAARKQHQQQGLAECGVLQQRLPGVSAEVLSSALLPPPDVPYMAAFAQLPKPGGGRLNAGAGAAATGAKKKKKKTKAKTVAKKGGAGGVSGAKAKTKNY